MKQAEMGNFLSYLMGEREDNSGCNVGKARCWFLGEFQSWCAVCEQTDEVYCQFRIKLGACVVKNLLQCNFQGQRLPVGAVGCHGIECVGYGKDARFE